MESATRTLQAERRIIQCEAVKMEESRTQRLAILRDAVLRTAPQRLSCVSSGLPWPIVSEDGVEDGQKLSSDRDEGNHLWLARRHQAIEEGLQDWVVLLGDHRAHEEDGAHWSAPATDKAVAPPLAGLASEGGKARQSGDLFAAELPELGQLGDQCASDGRADARHRGEQVFLVAPGWRAPYRIIDVGVDASQLLLQCLEEPIDAFLEARDRDTLLALAFGTDHLDDLPPPRNKVGQQSRRLVRERTRLWLGRLRKMRDDSRINWIGLCALADCLGKGANLGRIDDDDWKLSRSQSCRRNRLEAAGCLQSNNSRRNGFKPLDQLLKPRRITLHHKELTTGTNCDVEPVFRNVDTNDDVLHVDPSLPNRASRFAAPATVRVQRNRGRGPMLRSGLHGPRMNRSPVRHRIRQYTGCSDS